MAVDVHIIRVTDTEANVLAQIDDGQSVFLNDQGFQHVKRRGSLFDYFTPNKHWTGAAFVYHDVNYNDVTARNDLIVQNRISGFGDADTYLDYATDDQILAVAGAVEFWRMAETVQDIMTFNNGGVDIDYRFNTLANSPGIFIRGLDGQVGIGNAAPTTPLDVTGNINTSTRVIAQENDAVSDTYTTIAYQFSEGRGWGYNAADNSVFYNGAGGNVPFVVRDTGLIGMGTATNPLQNVGSAAGDFTGTGLHVKGAGITRLIVEGNHPGIYWADTAGAVDDKILAAEWNTEIFKFFTIDDDATAINRDNILTLNTGTGEVGIGIVPGGGGPTLQVQSTDNQMLLKFTGGGNAIFTVNTGGDLRMGSTSGKTSITPQSLFPFSPLALFHLQDTTEQFRIGFGATVFVAQTIDTNNKLTFLFNTAAKDAHLVLEHATNNDANGVKLTLFKNDEGDSASEDSKINFDYDNDNVSPAQTTFAQILSTHGVITDGSEEGGLKVLSQNGAGALGTMFEIDGLKASVYGETAVVRAAHIADASGGATVDAEARTAINAALVIIENFGLNAKS